MTKIKKLTALAVSALLLASLSACGTEEGDTVPATDVEEFTILLNDGTAVPCVRLSSFHGFDCNWDKAVRTTTPKP